MNVTLENEKEAQLKNNLTLLDCGFDSKIRFLN